MCKYISKLYCKVYTSIPVLCWQVVSVPHDEVLLPALRKEQAAVEATQSPPLDPFLQPDAQRSPPSPKRGEPEPLSDRAHREAGLSVEVFGEALVRRRRRN